VARYNRIKKKTDITAQDEFLSFWEHAYTWGAEKKERVLFPVLAVALIAVLVGGFFYYRSQREITAQRELYLALATAPREDTGKKVDTKKFISALDAVAERFEGTVGGKEALLYKGNVFYEQNKTDEAGKVYKSIVAGGKLDCFITRTAVVALGRIYQDNGKFDESTTLLKKYRKLENGALNEEMALIIARNYELAGDGKSALAEYDDFLAKYPRSMRAGTVRERADRLRASA
jgi:tetratricopeptide (TPR) repeat protein